MENMKSTECRRSATDRRHGNERREVYIFDYYGNNEVNKRKIKKDRRLQSERREGYVFVNKWSSTFLGLPLP
ncbi:MAG: hypothetical protein KAH06_04560 [Desulfobacterales bacterium]|nr:hypothetical protein [Desulfobacterales bacterium]